MSDLASKPLILLVDDDTGVIASLGAILQDFARVRFATSGPDALRVARMETPALVLLDVEMPGMSGLDVCKMMKENALLQDTPIVLMTSSVANEDEVAGLSLGAVDFVTKPLHPALVVARVRLHLRMREISEAVRLSATVDALTALANRRRFDEALAPEFARCLRVSSPLSLLLVDVDHFKALQDGHGLIEADQCLVQVARMVRAVARRPTDLVARWGGEQFAVLLPDTAAAGARQVAQNLLDAVDGARIPHARSPGKELVTVSIGISTVDGSAAAAEPSLGAPQGPKQDAKQAASPAQLYFAADRALYDAKSAGRATFRFCAFGHASRSSVPVTSDADEA